jgi:hypothetical protein
MITQYIASRLPPKFRSLLRAIRAYARMSESDRATIHEIASSHVGLHGERFKFMGDGLCTIHSAECLKEPRFQAAYRVGAATGSWNNWELPWRAYVLCFFALRASRLGGDFIECGVNRGGNARMIIDFVTPAQMPRLFLLDTFSGFDESCLSSDERVTLSGRYGYESCLEHVQSTFKAFPFV